MNLHGYEPGTAWRLDSARLSEASYVLSQLRAINVTPFGVGLDCDYLQRCPKFGRRGPRRHQKASRTLNLCAFMKLS